MTKSSHAGALFFYSRDCIQDTYLTFSKIYSIIFTERGDEEWKSITRWIMWMAGNAS